MRGVLNEHGLDTDAVLYLNADICRAELLVEIEAIGPTRALQDSGAAHAASSAGQDRNN